MAYAKTTWNAGIAPGISAINLNNLETQYDEVGNLFDAHSILIAIADNTPVVLTLAASRIVGRAAAGNIVALTGAEVLTIIGRVGKSNLEWTNAKLLLGAGAGSDPTEIDVPTQATFSTAEVFASAAAPVAYTDLDLSGVVGSNQAVVLLRVNTTTTTTTYTFRKNGETFDQPASSNAGGLTVLGQRAAAGGGYVLVVADASGVIEWIASANSTTVINMEAYWI